MKLRNTLFAASAALVLSGIVSNQEVEASSWQPRTVEQIKAEIENQKENQDDSGVIEYTFKEGDTLWGISEATSIPVAALTQVNSIANRDLIFVGNSIYLSGDNSIVSVKDENNQVTSYDVSEEVKETETPKEVSEKAQAPSQPVEESTQQASQPAAQSQAQNQSQPASQSTSQAETQSQPQEQASQPAQTSSSTGSLIGTFNATAYAVGDGYTPGTVTANGTNVANTIYSAGRRIIAVDPAVIPLGTTVEVHIPGWSPFQAVAADTGGAINGNKIDLLVSSPSEARNFGRKGGIQIYRVN